MKISPYSRIVVEGMDGSGKSTLVNQLGIFLGDNARMVPGFNRTPDPKPAMFRWWMDELNNHPIDKVIIHDRFFYPELVYGPILRGYVNAPDGTIAYVQEFLRKYAFLIYCRPPTSVLSEGVEVESQMKGVKENFTDLLIGYDRLIIDEAPQYNGRFVKYDWTDDKAFNQLLISLAGYIYE